MKIVTTEELINHKILPYNIYSEFGEKLFAAGEVLTPGKLLQLRHMETLYRDDEAKSEIIPEPVAKVEVETKIQEIVKIVEPEPVVEPIKVENPPTPASTGRIIVETFDMKPSGISRNKLSVDDIDIVNYRGPVNKKAKIDPQTQLKIKAFHSQIIEMMEEKSPMEMLGMFANIRDKIVLDIIAQDEEIIMSSQLRLLGEYNKCHAINTAILSGAVARKMDLSENLINDIVLAALLHDIGKTRIPAELLTKTSLSIQEQKLIQNHTKIGYQILKLEMKVPENIARVALDHHECNDGSGYPSGKSGERINLETHIVNVCNFFDDLTSNRTRYNIKNTKEAIRVLLEFGTKRFKAEALYTFVHMFSYNDTMNFEEMI